MTKYRLKVVTSSSLMAARGTVAKPRLDWYFNEIFQIRTFHDYLTRYDVINLREVCNSWKDSIDNYIERAHDVLEPDFNNYKSIVRSTSTISFLHKHDFRDIFLEPTLNHTINVETFLRELKIFPFADTFLSRRAHFHFILDAEFFFWDSIRAILDHHYFIGDNEKVCIKDKLRKMKFFYRSEETTVEMLNTINDCLERTPRLTSLECTLISDGKKKDGRKTEFQKRQSELPHFPILENLVKLSLGFGSCPVYEPFAFYFDNLVTLNICYSVDFMDWWNPEAHSTFPRLQHFAVCINGNNDLSKLQSLSSRLRELYIIGKPENYCPSVYLHYAEYFKETLAVFKIQQQYTCSSPMQTLTTLELPEPLVLDLPHLKAVSLNIMGCGFGPVDMLLKLTSSPEVLEVVVYQELSSVCEDHNRINGERRQTLEIHEKLEDMYNSNVWKLLKNLQEVYVRVGPDPDPLRQWGGTYTRAMYEYLQRGGNPRPVKRRRESVD